MIEDPLQLFPVEKWTILENIFKDDWPRSISSIIFLQMQKHLLERGIHQSCRVYCPYGDGQCGIVAINTKRGLKEVIIQCPSDDTSKLEQALYATNLIDWEGETEIPFVPKNAINCIERVIENKNVKSNLTAATTYVLDKSSALFNVKIPSGFSFDPLSLQHTDLLSTTWPHRFDGCNFYFESLIKAKLGYGLFKEKQLVSWALVRESGSLLHLYTLQEERRKGYGELVLKLISNFLLKNDKYVVAYCKKDNINAAKLYQKLNFQHISDVEWCNLTRKSE